MRVTVRLFSRAAPKTSDVYELMASACFGVPVSAVTKEERDRAKTISLGIVYGMVRVGDLLALWSLGWLVHRLLGLIAC